MRRLSGRTPLGEPIALCLPVYFHREFKQAARLMRNGRAKPDGTNDGTQEFNMRADSFLFFFISN